MKYRFLILYSSLSLISNLAFADTTLNKEVLQNPPNMPIKRSNELLHSSPNKNLKTSTTQSASDASFTWQVKRLANQLWNPKTQRYDKVVLRGYEGTNTSANTPFIAPTIDVLAGETIRANLNNVLNIDPLNPNKPIDDPTCVTPPSNVNTPHCFDGTNMHTHGLWINPAGNSDNVLISINPGVNFEYEYNIPPDHPAGTFWYHPHRHGSTAIQVGSGMAGALIIRGYRQPTSSKSGDLDLLTANFPERTIVFQQIQYACYDGDVIKKDPRTQNYVCDPGDIGEIVRSYEEFAPQGWSKSGRYTSINGTVQPTITDVTAGNVERWRMVHAGIRDSINLQIRKLENVVKGQDLSKLGEKELLEQKCTGALVAQNIVAADGLTLKQVQLKQETVFQPGYRFDALMQFPEEGQYCVIDGNAPASANVDRFTSERRLLALVNVKKATGSTSTLANALISNAQRNIDVGMRSAVIQNLQSGLKLNHFVPHQDLPETKNIQQLEFNIVSNGDDTEFQINGKPYQPNRIDRNLVLGQIDEWTLTSKLASHPFHIHVNPFQVVAIYDPNGKDVSGVDAIDDFGNPNSPDPQYRGLKGVWKDTLWVKNAQNQSYKLIVRTKYQRYIGEFVLHCHILDHEDQGMMQNVKISLPDGHGGASNHQH